MNLFDIVGGRQEIDGNAATQGMNVGLTTGGLSAQAGPAAFVLDVIKAKQAEEQRKATMAVEQQKARQAGIQRIITEGMDEKASPQAKLAAQTLIDTLQKQPAFAQAAGFDPSKFNSGTSLLNFGTANVGGPSVQDMLSNPPAGTTMNVGRRGVSYNFPLNASLKQDEQSALASLQTFEPKVQAMEAVLKSDKNPFKGMDDITRTIVQKAIDSEDAIFVSKMPREVQNFQSDLNSLRRYAFGEGGKNLTGTEKQIVYNLLNVTGKDDERISKDLNEAIAILRAKGNLITGGMQQAKENLDYSSALSAAGI